ncbi:uncharacterized protein LOC128890590 isoform X2 [Hylaeus anthracinus]|uniref:uncharacterized protein LOC128890590 isoform X2 n=1 Tax=Hylaeus anthracinus TaxID=313031 RepID=UPI0023B97F28|nr:uncharacterized protein LOC128890590 isoform X2 [Hylaeus anthracinus]
MVTHSLTYATGNEGTTGNVNGHLTAIRRNTFTKLDYTSTGKIQAIYSSCFFISAQVDKNRSHSQLSVFTDKETGSRGFKCVQNIQTVPVLLGSRNEIKF